VSSPGAVLNSGLDHLVVAADNLAQGVAWCESTLGVSPAPGGRHALMATHNRLLLITAPGWPQAYLEIIAIDPAAESAPADGRARWFGLDHPGLQAQLREGPRLVHFVARSAHIERAAAALAVLGEDPGQPVAAARATPQGELRWQISLRPDGVPQHGGGLPALIEWDGAHPADRLPASGVGLRSLQVAAPRAEALRRAHAAIDLHGLVWAPWAPGRPVLTAVLATPRGDVVLEGVRLGEAALPP
jgi:Glyoxalase-like domain